MVEVRYYDSSRRRLVYFSQSARPEYWDDLWLANAAGAPAQGGYPLVGRVTSRFLAPPARVLEGGCGRGNGVYELHHRGYDAYGIDFAPRTVALINEHAPELKVRLGDVRALPYESSSFDGYWSLGVIEHFWDGYQDIQSEMHRVLRPGGYLFLTVPSMSPLRRMKAMLNGYPPLPAGSESTEDFYQFVLSPDAVIADFAAAGFDKVAFFGYDAIKGMKDEVSLFKRPLQFLYDHPSRVNWLLRRAIERVASRLTYHIGVYVLRRQ